MIKVTKYVIYDIVRNRVLIAYTLFLFLIASTLFNMEEDPSKAIISLMSIVMIMVPLISIVFATTYFFNSYEFIELLVAQPLKRSTILLGEYIGVALSLSFAFFIGIGIPIILFDATATGFVLILSGILLTLVFISLAFLSSVITRDKAKGIGIALMIWFYFSIIYDALMLALLFTFSDYPLEQAMIPIVALNPIDLGRIIIMLKLDISALMGYTGALFKSFFGNSMGIFYTCCIMFIWIIAPLLYSIKVFNRKNL
jgi:Cu-processing system permease protein